MKYDLSVVIPARNEMFLARTIADVLEHMCGRTEIIAVLDGAWADPPIQQHPCVQVVHLPEPIGQRAATNLGARLSEAPYIMKLDGHCSLDQGFDVKLLRAAGELGREVIQVPAQYNLHAFDWVCTAGHRAYQGPTPEGGCRHQVAAGAPPCGQPVQRQEVWRPRRGTRTEAWRFDAGLRFGYWGDYGKRPEAQGDLVDVMSCLGACWYLDRGWYWELDGLDEAHGSWGQMGTELACKAWLSGGRLVVNKRTWFAHMFRTQGGDFGFPYQMSGADQARARERSRELWAGGRWPKAIRPLSWLVDRFAPVPGWDADPAALAPAGASLPPDVAVDAPQAPVAAPAIQAAPAVVRRPHAGLVYYSDNRLGEDLASAVRQQICRAMPPWAALVSVTLAPVPGFGDNLVLPRERGYLTMFQQILHGIRALPSSVTGVYLVEHDVLYHAAHFTEFTWPSDRIAYNQAVWKVDAATGRALHYRCNQTSGLMADRDLLLRHYEARVERVEREGFRRSMGFEPGTRQMRHGGVDDLDHVTWMASVPNIDVRHDRNLTASRWRQEQFRNRKFCQGWMESDRVPGWGVTLGRFPEFLRDIVVPAGAVLPAPVLCVV